MSEIRRYVIVNRDNIEADYEYDDMQEAINDAGTTSAVVERIYRFEDSELVWTPNGSGTWPPKKKARD